MLFSEAKTKTIKLINEYSNKSVVTSDTKNADYLLRLPDVIQAAQVEISAVKKIHAVYSISQNPIDPQNGRFQGFALQQHLNEDYTVTATGSQAYYFEIDHPATVYIEEEISSVWTLLSTVTDTTATSFTAYKGLITPSDTDNNVRLRFGGSYPYNMRNIALFSQLFASAADVPIYKPYVRYVMPADFFDLNKVIQLTDDRQYVNLGDFHWEGRKTIVINYFYTGSFDVYYYKYPIAITSSTLDAYVLELDDDGCELIPYYAAASLLMDDKETRAFGIIRLNEYQTKLANMTHGDNAGIEGVNVINGW